MAFSGYRMVYASVWDFRFNHIPLLRHSPFIYGAGPSTFDGFHSATFTRKANWGTHDAGAWGGAPGDAADSPRGTMAAAAGGVAAAAHHGHHGRSNGQGTHGGVVGTGAGPLSAGRHSVDRKPVGTSRYGEQVV